MPCPEQESAAGRGWLEEREPPAAVGHRAEAQDHAHDPERLLAEDRARIGRDLHDLVIRRLFAVSLKLSGALAMIGQNEAGRRVDEAIADLDQTVKTIRSVVFALERGSLPGMAPPTRATGGNTAG